MDKEIHPLKNTLLTKEFRETQVINFLIHQGARYLHLGYHLPLQGLKRQSQGTNKNTKLNLCICQKLYVMIVTLTGKLSSYADASHWTERQDQLCWYLDGKASDFYTIIVSRDRQMDYFDLIRKLKKRFNFFDLPDTLQIQFMGGHQNTTEKLEDWADRLLSQAIKAFRDLAEEHVYSQAVWRFCQGCCDKEADLHAAMSRPKSTEEAIDKIKWYQHTTIDICMKPVRQRGYTEDSEDEIEPVRSIKAVGRTDKKIISSTDQSEQLQSMEAQIKIIVDNTQLLQTKINSLETTSKQRNKNMLQL